MDGLHHAHAARCAALRPPAKMCRAGMSFALHNRGVYDNGGPKNRPPNSKIPLAMDPNKVPLIPETPYCTLRVLPELACQRPARSDIFGLPLEAFRDQHQKWGAAEARPCPETLGFRV